MIENTETDNANRNKPKIEKSITESVLDCFGPTLALEHVCGIFRFRMSNGNLMPTTGIMKLFGLSMTTTVAIIFIVSFNVLGALFGTEELTNVNDNFPAIVILIQYITSAAMTSCLLSKANIRIVSSLANLDSILHIDTSEIFYKKARNHTILVLTVILIIHLISSVSDFLLQTEGKNNIWINILNYILNCVQDLEILVFYLMISMLKSRLKVVNHYLVKFVHHGDNQDKISIYTIRQKNAKTEKKFDLLENLPVTNVRELSLAYDIIGETCHLVNRVYNFQIFMTLISAFVYIVITLWNSLYFFRTQVFTGNMISIILWCCSEMLTVASMAFVCETLLSTRNQTKVLVNELVMDYELSPSTRAQAKAFMELIDAWPLRINVYDMFSVDITLMLKFISVSTTYLIVIIQISHYV